MRREADSRFNDDTNAKKMPTVNADGVVGLEGSGDAGEGQKGDDHGDHNEQGSEHRNATSTSGTPGENNLGTETGKENQDEVNRENAGEEKSSDGKGLNELDDAEDGLVASVSSSNSALAAIKVCGSGSLLKAPGNAGAVVEQNVRGCRRRRRSDSGNQSDLLVQHVPVHDGGGDGDPEKGHRQEGSETVENTK